MPEFIVYDGNGAQVHRYRHDAQLTFEQWPGSTQVEVPAEAPPPAPAAAPLRITKLSFRMRFTQAERVAIEIASLDNPSASMEVRAQAAALRAYIKDIDAASHVDLNYPATRAGVQALEAAGLIAAGRAAVILDTPPADDEVWNG